MTLKSDQNLMKNLFAVSKMTKSLVNFDLSTRNSGNFYFYWFYWYITFDLKRSRGVIFHGKLACGLENGMTNTAIFHQNT